MNKSKSQYSKDLDVLGNALIKARKARGESWYDAINYFDKVLDDFEKKYGRNLWYEDERLKLVMNPSFHNGTFEKNLSNFIYL